VQVWHEQEKAKSEVESLGEVGREGFTMAQLVTSTTEHVELYATPSWNAQGTCRR
jgi:hypothetical protein